MLRIRQVSGLAALCVLLLFYVAPLRGQTSKVDFFKKQVASAKTEKERLSALTTLLQEFNSLERDTLRLYATRAKQTALLLKDEPAAMLAEYYLYLVAWREGYKDSCLGLLNRFVRVLHYSRANDNYTRFKLAQIDIISTSGDSRDGIDSAFNFLKVAEEAQDTILEIRLIARIGSMYSDIGQYADGLKWLYKAQNISQDPSYDEVKDKSVVYFNTGLDYNYLGKFDSAEYYADKTILVSKRIENLTMYAYGLGLKAYVYSYTNRAALAEAPLNEAVRLFKKIGALYPVMNAMCALAKYYSITGQPQKGIATCLDGLDLIKKHPILPLELLYDQLAENYRVAGDYPKYAATLRTIIQIKDSTYKKNSADALATMNAKYNVSTKEAFIAQQKLELLHKDIWIAIIATGSALLLIAAYLVFVYYRRRQKRHFEAEEEKERKRIAADLHDNIGAYASAISAGIDELEDKGSLYDEPSVRSLKSNADEIITALRDTIWSFNKESVSLTGISDRIKVYVQKIQPSYPHVAISVDENIKEDRKLSPIQSLNIFRIIQEALQNSLRHSHCNTLTIEINSEDSRYSITIGDDGKGFDPTKRNGSGNGMRNMKSRSDEAGFDLSVLPMLPRGTRVMVSSSNIRG